MIIQSTELLSLNLPTTNLKAWRFADPFRPLIKQRGSTNPRLTFFEGVEVKDSSSRQSSSSSGMSSPLSTNQSPRQRAPFASFSFVDCVENSNNGSSKLRNLLPWIATLVFVYTFTRWRGTFDHSTITPLRGWGYYEKARKQHASVVNHPTHPVLAETVVLKNVNLSLHCPRASDVCTVRERRWAGNDARFITQLPRFEAVVSGAGIPLHENSNRLQSRQSWPLLFLGFKESQWCCSSKRWNLYAIRSSFCVL